jgi:D-sedoheptulose 7-phosphate isomerase
MAESIAIDYRQLRSPPRRCHVALVWPSPGAFAARLMTASAFTSALAEHQALFASLGELQPAVERTAQRLAECLRAGGKILLCGNGGSAADSQHIAAELTGRFVKDRAPLAGLALSTDSSALTCIGNDYGFEAIFERQVRGLGRAGDVLIGISTSGQSSNVIRAVEAARAMGITTIGLLGRDGGALAALCDDAVVVPGRTTARIQEAHIFIGHNWCTLVEQHLGVGQ